MNAPPKVAPVNVTDHALLRWIERVEKVDVAAVRARIVQVVGPAAGIGAPYVVHDGFSVILEGAVVITVLDRHQRPKVGRNGRARYPRSLA